MSDHRVTTPDDLEPEDRGAYLRPEETDPGPVPEDQPIPYQLADGIVYEGRRITQHPRRRTDLTSGQRALIRSALVTAVANARTLDEVRVAQLALDTL